MAAASNKPGGVHYALIIFVMATVVLGILSYMNHREMSDKLAELAKKTEDAGKLTKQLKDADDRVQILKKLTGRSFDQVDDPGNPANANTVKAAAIKDMQDYGKDLAGKDYAESLQKLREALDAALVDRDSKAVQVASLQKDLQAEKSRLNTRIDTANKAQTKAESDKRDVIASQDERLKAKQDEIDRLKQDNNSLTGELQTAIEAHDITKKKLTKRIGELESIVDHQKDEIDKLQKVSFEVADGLIQRVDNASKMVWINLGEADFLKPRMTFSVYGKENQGVGRGAEDIKGKIEVTRILAPHMAEARIIEEDLIRPMVANDLLYTPLWSPGLIEKISIVGPIDLDKDGKSDREEFKKILAISGASIDNEVDDEGNRFPEGGKITVQTKFLVLGDIPEPDKVVNEDDKAKVVAIRKHLTEMLGEARVNGVRVIKLNDFLAFVGFESKRRTFRPGQERPFSLKAGSTSTATDETLGDRSSNGNVSGGFGTNRKSAPQHASDGSTSQLFGGKKK